MQLVGQGNFGMCRKSAELTGIIISCPVLQVTPLAKRTVRFNIGNHPGLTNPGILFKLFQCRYGISDGIARFFQPYQLIENIGTFFPGKQ